MLRYIIVLLFLSCFCNASGQNRLRLSVEYGLPLGQMNWSYKPAPGANLAYIMTKRIDKQWKKVLGFGVGYSQFNPLADTLYYTVDKGGVDGMKLGRAAFSPFKIYVLSAIAGFEKRLSKKAALCFDLSVGYYYGQRDIYLEDEFGAEDGLSEFIGRAGLAPRMGVAFNLNKAISISPFVSYTLMIQLGNTDPDSMNYNPDTGLILHYYSPGVALDFHF